MRNQLLAHAFEPAVTLDGTRIEVLVNVGGLKDAGQIAGLGGEGVGLLRSEFLFMERPDAPTEEQQFETYKAIAQAVESGRPIIIRTLDVGGDKPLSYLPIPKEDNPFLGERGVRVSLDRPEILRTQLRAILRAAASGKVSVMFPIMVEVPATAIMAAQFAREAEFFHRHERPHAIHPRDGSRASETRSASGRSEPSRAQTDRAYGQWCSLRGTWPK